MSKLLNSSYRWISLVFLAAIFVISAAYGGLVVFYATSSSWAAPVTLSPTADRVLTFQPQVANLEALIDKQKIELQTAVATQKFTTAQIEQITQLIAKVDETIAIEAKEQGNIGESATKLAAIKRRDISRANVAANEARRMLATVDQELAAKLITSDQAAARKIGLISAINAVTDSNINALQLENQARQAAAGSITLSGGASSLVAISAVKQSIELKAMLAQLQIQQTTAMSNVTALTSALAGSERVLAVAKTSPYYRALREEVTVAFVPYSNLDGIEVGDKVYDCYLQVLLCHKVGKIITIYDAEEHTRHPLFKTDLRGRLVEIKFTDPDSSKSQVVFIGGKPLLL